MTIKEMKEKFAEIDRSLSELLVGLREGPVEVPKPRPGPFNFGECEIVMAMPKALVERALEDVRHWLKEMQRTLENPRFE